MFSSRHENQSRRQFNYHHQQSISKSRFTRSMDDVSMQIGVEQNVNNRRYQKYNNVDYFLQSPSYHASTRPKYSTNNHNDVYIRSQNIKHEKRPRQYYNDLKVDTSYFNENHQVKFLHVHHNYKALIT